MRWSETVRSWGTSAAERGRRYPCDEVLPDANDAFYRGVTVFAAPPIVFGWLCQLRVAPYSYDWLDNFGRRSPQQRSPELEQLAPGQRFMRSFDLVEFERDVHVTLGLRSKASFPPLAVSYCIDAGTAGHCRLVVKLVVEHRPGWRHGAVRRLGPSLDWIMMRRQLLNLKALAERDERRRREAAVQPRPGSSPR